MRRRLSREGASSTVLLTVIIAAIVVSSGALYYLTQSMPTREKSKTSTQEPLSGSVGFLRIEEAQLSIDNRTPSCPPAPCSLRTNQFTIVVRNLAKESILKLQVELGNSTSLETDSPIAPGQVYAGGATPQDYPVCTYHSLRINGILSNQTSFEVMERVLAEGEYGPSCTNEPLLLARNQVVVPKNATDFSSLPGNITWTVVAKNTGTQSIMMAYATLTLSSPMSANGSGYKSVTLDLGTLSPGDTSSGRISTFVSARCCAKINYHVKLLNGTSLDFATFPLSVDQRYLKVFGIGRPGIGLILAKYVFPNFTKSINLTQITVTSLSGSAGIYPGITVAVSPATISSKPGYLTSVNLTIRVAMTAIDGVYLITYPLDECPGIILAVGALPNFIPPVPPRSDCLNPQTIPESQQVKVVAGFDVVYLPEEISGA